MKRIAILDIESNNLLSNSLDYSSFPYKLTSEARLWTVVIRDYKTNEVFFAENEGVTKEWMKETLAPYDVLVTHNGVKFDLLMLKLFGVLDYKIGWLNDSDTLFGRDVTLIDTLLLSQLFNPSRFGGHSLKAWGKRLLNYKDDYREQCIEKGYIEANAPKGAEFASWNELLLPYCIQDTNVTKGVFSELLKEWISYKGWNLAVKQEHILADVSIKREIFGFDFNKSLAISLLEDLKQKMDTIRMKINPLLPRKKLNKGELSKYIPPKLQVTAKGEVTVVMQRWVDSLNGTIEKSDLGLVADIFGKKYTLPMSTTVKTEGEADIDDLDHVKEMLMKEYGWEPSEWRERDLTKDAKKLDLPYEKRLKAAERYIQETMAGKYTDGRFKEMGIPKDEESLREYILPRLNDKFPVRVPTSPLVRVGVEKELCPNLVKLGDKVAFAKDFAEYLTYKHRKSSIAGGDVEDMDFDTETPNKGYLANVRSDGRIATPAIEIGAQSTRYKHITVANIPRVTSLYGKELRSLFGCGKGYVQLGYDFASLEARIMGHYSWDYPHGQDMADMLLAEKPNDWHSVTARKIDIPRSECKSVNYGLIYGSQAKKVAKMLHCSIERGKEVYEEAWNAMPALKLLKTEVEKQWEDTGKQYVVSIDGRKILTRSKHSLLNFLFQSAGIIVAKYVNILCFEKWEKEGFCIDPFEGKPDIKNMIDYHDEVGFAINPIIVKYKVFQTKEEAESFQKKWGDTLYHTSAIRETKDSRFFICLPNIVSKTVEDAVREAEKLLNLKVPIGIEWIVGRNWAECH